MDRDRVGGGWEKEQLIGGVGVTESGMRIEVDEGNVLVPNSSGEVGGCFRVVGESFDGEYLGESCEGFDSYICEGIAEEGDFDRMVDWLVLVLAPDLTFVDLMGLTSFVCDVKDSQTAAVNYWIALDQGFAVK